jgi:hypothetical protein
MITGPANAAFSSYLPAFACSRNSNSRAAIREIWAYKSVASAVRCLPFHVQ